MARCKVRTCLNVRLVPSLQSQPWEERVARAHRLLVFLVVR